VAPQFKISDVALKNTCRSFDIPVPPRGYWAKLQAGKPATKVALPSRAAGMNDEVAIGGRNPHWSYGFTNEEILGPVPYPPSFPEDLPLVRDRIRKTIDKVGVPRAMTVHHPAIARLIAHDEIRRQKQAASSHSFSWDNPVFDSPFEQRRLRFLNALFLAVARCGGKAEVRGREAREISITIHQTRVSVSLDRPTKGRGKTSNQGVNGPDQLRLVIQSGYDREQEQASWQDGEGGRLEQFIEEIALEVVTSAEISYREGCFRAFEWRVRRKAQLEEQARDLQLQMEREIRERQQELQQARIDRLLDESASLRRATDIRAYVEAVKTTVANDAVLISLDSVEQWSKWALAEADRIDPVKTARFLDEVEAQDDTK
jgi:hypothetical protein